MMGKHGKKHREHHKVLNIWLQKSFVKINNKDNNKEGECDEIILRIISDLQDLLEECGV